MCLGIQVECVAYLSPFSEYKQVFLSFYSKRSIPDRGRPAVASSVTHLVSLKTVLYTRRPGDLSEELERTSSVKKRRKLVVELGRSCEVPEIPRALNSQ